MSSALLVSTGLLTLTRSRGDFKLLEVGGALHRLSPLCSHPTGANSTPKRSFSSPFQITITQIILAHVYAVTVPYTILSQLQMLPSSLIQGNVLTQCAALPLTHLVPHTQCFSLSTLVSQLPLDHQHPEHTSRRWLILALLLLLARP